MVTMTPPVIDYPEDYRPRRRGWRAALAAAGVVAASGPGVAALIIVSSTPKPTPAPTPVVYSQQDVSNARKEACDTAISAGAVMQAQRQPSLDNPDDRGLFAAEQAGIASGVNDIRAHLHVALPSDVRDAINAYADAQIHVSAADAKLIWTDFERFGHSDAQARRQAALDNVTEAEKRANAANTRMVTLCHLG